MTTLSDVEFKNNRYKYAMYVSVAAFAEQIEEYLEKVNAGNTLGIPTRDIKTAMTYAKKFASTINLKVTDKQVKNAISIVEREYRSEFEKVKKDKNVITEDMISSEDFKYLPLISAYSSFIENRISKVRITKEQAKYAKYIVTHWMKFQNMWEGSVI